MRWILFLNRVALLCNVCFVMVMIIRYTKNFIHNQPINSYIITLGYSSFIVNFFVTILLLILLLGKKKSLVPTWLSITNFLFFVIQILIFLIS